MQNKGPLHSLFAVLILALTLLSGCSKSKPPPNFILIVSDDQRNNDLESRIPLIYKRIFLEGARFEKAYATTPACCPSRASILTGLYAKNSGVKKNSNPLTKPTIVTSLKERGYYTGLVGKYLNSWDGIVRPEYDFWVSARAGHIRYTNPKLNIQGEVKEIEGYSTYILKDYVKEFIGKAVESTKPFFLLFTPFAPHSPATPAPEDREFVKTVPPLNTDNYREADRSDKPSWVQAIKLDHRTWNVNDKARARQIATLRSLDRSIDEILTTLSNLNVAENTYVIYLSDNGVLWGEHGLIRKDVAYEPAINIPLAIKGPSVVSGARADLVGNIDLAPTICELSGAKCADNMDGKSLVPLLRNDPVDWRHHLFIEGWGALLEGKPKFTAIHTGKTVLIRSGNGEEEFYKLSTDPFQLTNRINNPAAAAAILPLRRLLDERK